MASTKTPAQLAQDSENLAVSFEYVLHGGVLYAPVDYETGDDTVIPPIERKSWIPMDDIALLQKARSQYDTLFKDRTQLASFQFMVEQAARFVPQCEPWLLIKTKDGLCALHEDGKLYEPDGSFVANALGWMLNEDPDDKAVVLKTIVDWVGGDEEIAMSLIHHLATALAPHWSAGKYLLLIGDGRNGKSLLMMMLQDLFNRNNCSTVTRQQLSEADKNVFDLNGKLLNLVFDGPAEFVKDSSREKSIITGEAIGIRKLYSNTTTTVQTNALFVEGLNQEPKSRDKSSALQARLIRFLFLNKYADNQGFAALMRSEQMLGALLSLLIDNYVQLKDIRVMLAPTSSAIRAQLEHMEENSQALQFLVYLEETDPLGAEQLLVGMDFNEVAQRFQSWRLLMNDLTAWDVSSLNNLFRPVLVTERKSRRIANHTAPLKVRYVTRIKPEAQALLASLKYEEEVNALTVVADEQL